MDFKAWLEEKTPSDALALPSVKQQTSYSCGSAALRSIFKYFNINLGDEKDYIKFLKSDKDQGTTPENLVKAAKQCGLKVNTITNMSLRQLTSYLDKKVPILVAIQAWGQEKEYPKDQSGHYVVVVGHDDKNIYFEDPVLKGKRGFLPHEEFVSRWHDLDSHGHRCNRLGIAMWKPGAKPHPKPEKATNLIHAEKS